LPISSVPDRPFVYRRPELGGALFFPDRKEELEPELCAEAPPAAAE
jgi:hypothetical protein